MRTPRLRRPVLLALVAGGVVIVVAVVVVVLVLTRGPSSPGAVTFAAGGATATADPTVYCDVEVTECEQDRSDDALAHLRVPPGTDLTVTVPAAVAATPWQVAFTFRDAAGVEQSGRSPVFAPHARTSFTLVIPDPRGQLETAEVQQYGARIVTTSAGPGFSTRAAWALSATG